MAKIGLALSGGGVRAFAHIGVLSNLNWAGIRVNIVSGSSVGALAGAIFASNANLELAKNIISKLSFFKIFNPILPYLGLSNFEKIKKIFYLLNIPKNFSDLKIPLIVAATDIKKRETVYFNNGNLWDALFASMAIPGIFYPIKMGETLLIDGGITANLPVNILKQEGVDFIIACDVNTSSRKYPSLTNSFQIVYEATTLLVEMNSKRDRELADFIIDVNLPEIGFLDFKKGKEVLNISQKETYSKIIELKKTLEEKNYVQDRGLGPLFISPLS